MVEEAVDLQFNAIVLIPIVGVSVHVTEMFLGVANLLCTSGHQYPMAPLALPRYVV